MLNEKRQNDNSNGDFEPALQKKVKCEPSELWHDIESDEVLKTPFLSQGKVVKAGANFVYFSAIGPAEPKVTIKSYFLLCLTLNYY